MAASVLVWDLESGEHLNSQLDSLDIHPDIQKEMLKVKPNFERELKMHYVQRILTPNRFTGEILYEFISTRIMIDKNQSLLKNLTAKLDKLSVDDL
jgi:hypothetical protein